MLDQLRPDFPDVTISKIRFLEAKGLVEPERTPSGYRKFSHDDVERLRYVLRAQRDHYLPLRVIKEHLDAIDRGLEPPPIEPVVPDRCRGVALAADGLPGRRVVRADATELRLSRERAARRSPRSPRTLLDQLEQYGLVTPAAGHRRTTTPTRWSIATTAARAGRRSASSRGTCARSRPPPTARSAWSSRSSPRMRGGATPRPRARAEEAVREIAALSVRLHADAGQGRAARRTGR